MENEWEEGEHVQHMHVGIKNYTQCVNVYFNLLLQ